MIVPKESRSVDFVSIISALIITTGGEVELERLYCLSELDMLVNTDKQGHTEIIRCAN
jgi:hypothetical protein